jgi:hypothetical protein
MENLEHLHIIQNKGDKRQYFTMVEVKETDTQDDLDTRAEETAERLEKRFGGFMEIRTTEEVVASNVNYPREGNSKKILLRVSQFA